jgi:hypothetical protein
MNEEARPTEPRPARGSTIGRTEESGADTVPGGAQPGDERIAAHSTESSGVGKEDERSQGRDDEWPAGHRER